MRQKVKIIPKTQRAHNRVAEHGEVMSIRMEGTFNGQTAILVESPKETWGSAGRKSNWMGWFTTDEADWERL
jgi:hypothetical protein